MNHLQLGDINCNSSSYEWLKLRGVITSEIPCASWDRVWERDRGTSLILCLCNFSDYTSFFLSVHWLCPTGINRTLAQLISSGPARPRAVYSVWSKYLNGSVTWTRDWRGFGPTQPGLKGLERVSPTSCLYLPGCLRTDSSPHLSLWNR